MRRHPADSETHGVLEQKECIYPAAAHRRRLLPVLLLGSLHALAHGLVQRLIISIGGFPAAGVAYISRASAGTIVRAVDAIRSLRISDSSGRR